VGAGGDADASEVEQRRIRGCLCCGVVVWWCGAMVVVVLQNEDKGEKRERE
jgi:hypothetical protein